MLRRFQRNKLRHLKTSCYICPLIEDALARYLTTTDFKIKNTLSCLYPPPPYPSQDLSDLTFWLGNVCVSSQRKRQSHPKERTTSEAVCMDGCTFSNQPLPTVVERVCGYKMGVCLPTQFGIIIYHFNTCICQQFQQRPPYPLI
jgi:hypothetical protein